MTADKLTMRNARFTALVTATGEVIQTPILLAITEVELNLETERVVIDDLVCSEVQVRTEQHHMTPFTGVKMGFDHHHDVESFRKRLVEHVHLVGINLIPSITE